MDTIMVWSGAGIALTALLIRIIMHFRFQVKEEKLNSHLDQKYGRIDKE